MVAYNISTDTSRTTSIPSKPGRVHLSSNNEDFGSDYIIGKNIQVGKGSGSCVEYYAIVQVSFVEYNFVLSKYDPWLWYFIIVQVRNKHLKAILL